MTTHAPGAPWQVAIGGYENLTCVVVKATSQVRHWSPTGNPAGPAIQIVVADALLDLVGEIADVTLTRDGRSRVIKGLVDEVTFTGDGEPRTVIISAHPTEEDTA